jgi:thiamine biosynthesis protein ThiS
MIMVNGLKINFENGMTVADALKAAGEGTGAMALIVVNGTVLPCNKVHMEQLSDGTHIKVLPLMSGG